MAAYGDPHRFNLSELFSFSADHEALFMNSQLINNQSTSCFESHCNAPFISSVVDIPPVPSTLGDWQQVHYDLAASVQHTFTDAYLGLIRYFVSLTGIKNVCLSGGCTLNCLANMTLFTDSELNVYVQPAASDRGLSIGSA